MLEEELAEAVLNLRHLQRGGAGRTPEEARFVHSRSAALRLAVRDAREGLRRLREPA